MLRCFSCGLAWPFFPVTAFTTICLAVWAAATVQKLIRRFSFAHPPATRHYLAMKFIAAAFLFLTVLGVPSSALALTLAVRVEGVRGDLRQNVLSELAIYRHRQNLLLRQADVRRLHRRARADIVTALAPLGYFSPQVTAALRQEQDGFSADYHIIPGQPTRVRALILECADAQAAWFREAAALFSLKPGDIADQGRYEDGKKRLLRAANRQGFLDAKFSTHQFAVNKKERTADIRLRLEPGPLYHFADIDFAPTVIRPSLLRGYLNFQPGDPYRADKLADLQRALYATGYFARARVDAKPDNSAFTVPVFVSAEPQRAWNHYSFGAGYATDTGMRGRVDWFNRRWNDRGHTVHGSAQVSENENTLGLGYKIPVGDPDNDQYAVAAAYADQSWDHTETRLESLTVGRDHGGKLFRYGESLELRHERYSVGVTSGEKLLLMPGFTASLVDADNLLQPTKGAQITASALGAWQGLVSDSSFLKLSGGAKLIVSPLKTVRLVGRAGIGVIIASAIDDLPPSLRFYAGGDNSVRGYGYKDLGPKDESGVVVGGRYLLDGGVEVEKLIGQYWGLAAFWDMGNAMDDFSVRLKQGVGVGLRLRLPFGQVRLDVASAIEEDGWPLRLHLSVGSDL
ncbi:MAG: autotransporter assembly complex protein TamA [Desulfobulbaceae bacterium]|jgi:translocation and assembly module TamA|nr:autotransporter assembly complex protein TamA [Desulfobulbaceae bacterium]